MRCGPCGQPVRPGMETTKRVEIRRDSARPDAKAKIYGENMPDGPLSKARGVLVEVRHQKCHWVVAKRVRRGGDAVQGTRPGLLDPYADDDDE